MHAPSWLSPQLPLMAQMQRIARIWLPGMVAFVVWVLVLVWLPVGGGWLFRLLGLLPLWYTYHLLDLHQEQHGPYGRRARQ